ncbi:MAG: NADH:ubiquinone reductase (Na(+)-transporting) subunit D [Deltaproteobacteria bacterium]|nr:NADH:ubiquinone reductase (Na(+)-transporting) subunit D [Deltaproteobacteria bacterium]MBW1944640.1 NADH:ubiquinone reductase (Na(+)-transporting) subunit D [Deltaproteobacteria bacterium]
MPKPPSHSDIFKAGLWKDNPVLRQVLGICSTLAVTNLMVNTLVMNAGLIFTLAMSSLTVSLLRKYTPMRIRMMVQTLIIASYVIMVDIVIKGYLPDISEALGPYVGLIITNCIIMGRCEAFARNNPPWPAFVDGIAVGIGYALVLMAIAIVREPLGFGTLLGFRIMPGGFTPWTVMIMAPGAFFMLGIYIWIIRAVFPQTVELKKLG